MENSHLSEAATSTPNMHAQSHHENRSDSGQFRSDFVPPWSRRQNESAADYQLFAAWLKLPPPRHLRKAAKTLNSTLGQLRRLSAQHNWQIRAEAFDRRQADEAETALHKVLTSKAPDWDARREQMRNDEWDLKTATIQAAHHALAQFRKHPERASLSDILALLKLGSELGRYACDLPMTYIPPEPAPSTLEADIEAALNRVYGQPDPEPSPTPPPPQKVATSIGPSEPRQPPSTMK